MFHKGPFNSTGNNISKFHPSDLVKNWDRDVGDPRFESWQGRKKNCCQSKTWKKGKKKGKKNITKFAELS